MLFPSNSLPCPLGPADSIGHKCLRPGYLNAHSYRCHGNRVAMSE